MAEAGAAADFSERHCVVISAPVYFHAFCRLLTIPDAAAGAWGIPLRRRRRRATGRSAQVRAWPARRRPSASACSWPSARWSTSATPAGCTSSSPTTSRRASIGARRRARALRVILSQKELREGCGRLHCFSITISAMSTGCTPSNVAILGVALTVRSMRQVQLALALVLV